MDGVTDTSQTDGQTHKNQVLIYKTFVLQAMNIRIFI